MKKVITIMAALLLAGVAYAQPGGGFGGGMPMMPMGGMGMFGGDVFEVQENIKKTVDSLTIELSLDKKQAKKMKKALEDDYNNDAMGDIQSLISSIGIDFNLVPDEEAAKAVKDREERYAKFLTPEQFDKWKANEQAALQQAAEQAKGLMEQFQNGGGFPGGGFPGGGFPGGGFPGGGMPPMPMGGFGGGMPF